MNKNFLIFGGTSGIGLEVIKQNLKKKINFFVIGRNFNEIKKLSIKKNKIKIINFDLNKSLKSFPFKKIPKFDYFLFSSGFTNLETFSSIDEKNFDKMLNVNVLKIAKLISKFFNLNLINNNASLVIVSSIGGNNIVMPGQYSYSISKAALNGMIKSLAIELAKYNVRVNSVNPAMVKTPLIDAYKLTSDGYFIKKDKQKYPLYKDYLKPKDVAYLIDFLLFSRSKSITGQSIVIDNGFTLIR